jgi:sugar O-acyltransferase (sialic acid O-acetyltransferase NeuD family)
MKNLLIIGARGFGREIANIATQCQSFMLDWNIKGFLDDKVDALNNYNGYPPIIDSVEQYEVRPDDVFVCALGDVYQKHKYVEIIKNKGGRFISLIHNTSTFYQEFRHGEGLILFPYSVITCSVTIGEFITILPFTVLGHDVVVGDYCHLDSHTFLGGFVNIGSFVTIHTRATIVPRLQIGDHAVIGAGSVVIQNVQENYSVFGNPARPFNTGSFHR